MTYNEYYTYLSEAEAAISLDVIQNTASKLRDLLTKIYPPEEQLRRSNETKAINDLVQKILPLTKTLSKVLFEEPELLTQEIPEEYLLRSDIRKNYNRP